MTFNPDDPDVLFVCGELQVAMCSLRTMKILPRTGEWLSFKRIYRVEGVKYSYDLNGDDNAYLKRIVIQLKILKLDEVALERGEFHIR